MNEFQELWGMMLVLIIIVTVIGIAVSVCSFIGRVWTYVSRDLTSELLKSVWVTLVSMMVGFIIIGMLGSAVIFIGRTWEFINTEQFGTQAIIKGDVTIVPNDKGEVYMGNLVLCQGVNITGQGADKTTIVGGSE